MNGLSEEIKRKIFKNLGQNRMYTFPVLNMCLKEIKKYTTAKRCLKYSEKKSFRSKLNKDDEFKPKKTKKLKAVYL